MSLNLLWIFNFSEQVDESVGSQWERGSCGATRGGGTPVIKLGASTELGANVPESTMFLGDDRSSCAARMENKIDESICLHTARIDDTLCNYDAIEESQ